MSNSKISALTSAATIVGTEVLPIVQSSATVKVTVANLTPGLGTITAAKGGTGQTSYAVGDILYADTTTTLAKLADVATGNALISGGVTVAPSWGKIGLTTHVSGILPVANGGTATSTAFTTGSVVFAGASGVYSQNNANFFWDNTNTRLGIGTASPGAKLEANDGTYYMRFSPGADGTIVVNGTTGLTLNSSAASTVINFRIAGTDRARIDSVGNAQFQTGAVMPYAPAPSNVSAATTLSNANIQGQIINTTGTSYTVTMPLGTTLESLATWATTNVAYDFYVINTASGTITFAVNTGVTSLGTLTVATGVSAQFRIRRTAANTFVLYRLG